MVSDLTAAAASVFTAARVVSDPIPPIGGATMACPLEVDPDFAAAAAAAFSASRVVFDPMPPMGGETMACPLDTPLFV